MNTLALLSGAFGLLAVHQIIRAVGDIPLEERSWVYLLRLAAFLLIIVAILAEAHADRD